MQALTELPDTHLEDALSRYDIGQLQRYWPASNGIENSNYFVTTEHDQRQRQFVLTIMEQPANAGEAYVGMMDRLFEGGLPVAPPIRNLADLAVEDICGKPALLQPRLSGHHVCNPTRRQIGAIARFVARMHLQMQTSDIILPDYPRDRHWLAERSQLTQGYLDYARSTLLNASLRQVDSLLTRNDVQQLPQGMIHGDLFRDNVLFNEHGLSGVLDFHHAAQGYWIYDLAVIANDWCTDASGLLDAERTTAMLKAYHQIRPLEDAELWFFSTFCLYAGLTFWLSRLSVALQQQHAQRLRFKNPEEFQRIVAQHQRHAFYIDPRVLSGL